MVLRTFSGCFASFAQFTNPSKAASILKKKKKTVQLFNHQNIYRLFQYAKKHLKYCKFYFKKPFKREHFLFSLEKAYYNLPSIPTERIHKFLKKKLKN